MDKYEAQRLGTNADAQSVLKNEVSAFFPQLEAEQELSAEVIVQFYDWQFPFTYTQDGGGARRWRASVRAVCRRNKKLQQLEELFESSGTDGTLKEVYSGQDEDEYTDNHATRTKTEFAGVGTTTSENLGDTQTTEPVDGKNNTVTVRKKGTTRTYADGRTWTQILKDVGAAVDPVGEFVNAFAQVLLPPCEESFCPLPPSVSMAVEAEELPTGAPPTAKIVNKGSSLAADWLLSLGIPLGAQGEKGDKGDRGDTGPAGAALYRHSLQFKINNTHVTFMQNGQTYDTSNFGGALFRAVFTSTKSTPYQSFMEIVDELGDNVRGSWNPTINIVGAELVIGKFHNGMACSTVGGGTLSLLGIFLTDGEGVAVAHSAAPTVNDITAFFDNTTEV